MRKLLWPGPSIVIVALCLSGTVASADDATSLLDKIDAAQSTVHSYQVTVTGPGDRTASNVVVHGVGSVSRTTSKQFDSETYIVGTTMYQRMNGGAWMKFVIDPAAAASLGKSITRHRSTELLPDRTEDGVTVGAIKVDITLTAPSGSPGWSEQMTVSSLQVCTYDKATLLYRTCKSDTTTRQYSHYNDPSLTIEVPAEALTAPELRLPGLQKTP